LDSCLGCCCCGDGISPLFLVDFDGDDDLEDDFESFFASFDEDLWWDEEDDVRWFDESLGFGERSLS